MKKYKLGSSVVVPSRSLSILPFANLLDPETGTNKTNNMCTVSDCNRHGAEAIWAHIIPILKRVKDIMHIDTVHFVTDSTSSQYRGRKIFFVISQLQQQFSDLNIVTWNYLESGHGKGAPDGIGAATKCTADSCVKDLGRFLAYHTYYSS